MLYALLQVAGKIAEHDNYPIAPDTVVGWASPILLFLTLVGIAIGWGKWIERFNGLGKRFDTRIDEVQKDVTALATAQTSTDAEARVNAANIRTLISQHSDLILKLGEHGRSTEACREDTDKLGVDLGLKITGLTAAVSSLDKSVSNRLVAIETTLRIKPPKESVS